MERPGAALLAVALVTAGWLSACRSNASTQRPEMSPTAIAVERGAELYGLHCQSCHGGETGGQITDVPPPHNANGHTWHHPDCQLIGTVMRGGAEMPAFEGQLSEADVAAILAYIKIWWAEEQRAFQEEVTAASC